MRAVPRSELRIYQGITDGAWSAVRLRQLATLQEQLHLRLCRASGGQYRESEYPV